MKYRIIGVIYFPICYHWDTKLTSYYKHLSMAFVGVHHPHKAVPAADSEAALTDADLQREPQRVCGV